MDHPDHINLLQPAGLSPGGTWADFGAGSGAFTLALRELVGPEAQIYAIDKDRGRLRELEDAWQARFGEPANLHLVPADFSRPVELPVLDGALMANSLHYLKDPPRGERIPASGRPGKLDDKLTLLRQIRSLLKPGGAL